MTKRIERDPLPRGPGPGHHNGLATYKFNDAAKEIYLEALRKPTTRSEAAKRAGVTVQTVRQHMKIFPEFAEAVMYAEIDGSDVVESVLYEMAIEEHSFPAVSKILDNRNPERWRDMRRSDTQIIQINQQLGDGDSATEISRLREQLEQRKALQDGIVIDTTAMTKDTNAQPNNPG
jgi:hypothetical protein